MGPWLGKRTRQCRQRRHYARPSPPTHDWVLRPLTRRASSSAPHVQGGLFSFPLGREEAMAAMASFGALALLLLSGLSCCSGSGLAGTCFGRALAPWQVVLGEEGCARGGDLVLPGARRYWRDLPPWVSCCGYQSTTHRYTRQPGCWKKLPCLLLGEPQRSTMLQSPVPARKVISLVPVSEGSRTRAVLAARNQYFI